MCANRTHFITRVHHSRWEQENTEVFFQGYRAPCKYAECAEYAECTTFTTLLTLTILKRSYNARAGFIVREYDESNSRISHRKRILVTNIQTQYTTETNPQSKSALDGHRQRGSERASEREGLCSHARDAHEAGLLCRKYWCGIVEKKGGRGRLMTHFGR